MKDALLCYGILTVSIIPYLRENEKYFHKIIQEYFGRITLI